MKLAPIYNFINYKPYLSLSKHFQFHSFDLSISTISLIFIEIHCFIIDTIVILKYSTQSLLYLYRLLHYLSQTLYIIYIAFFLIGNPCILLILVKKQAKKHFLLASRHIRLLLQHQQHFHRSQCYQQQVYHQFPRKPIVLNVFIYGA